MERRDLPAVTPTTAILTHGIQAIVSRFDRLHNDPISDQAMPHALAAKQRFAQAYAHSIARRIGSRLDSVTVEQQNSLANTLFQIADSILDRLSKTAPESLAAATQARQALTQLMNQSLSRSSAIGLDTPNTSLEGILDKFGPSDPFASLDVIPTSSLKPGDIIVRCTASLGSQAIELAHWSRYSHVALYIGQGRVIDAMANGVHTRGLNDLLSESNRVGVLRVPGLTPSQARAAIRAAQAHEGAKYNFEGVKALEIQKLTGVIGHANEGLSGIIGVLCRAERLPANVVDNGTFACSQLVRYAYKNAGIILSQANGLAPGDVIRLGMVGVLDEVGRLEIPAQNSSSASAWLP